MTMSDAITMYGNIVAVGISPPIYPFSKGGSVVLYRIDDNGKMHKFQTITSWTTDMFGLSVALSDSLLAVGAPEQVLLYEPKGRHGKFRYTQTIKAASNTGMDLFGQHVAIHKDTLVVGAYLKDGPGGGSAYVFSRKPTGKWMQVQELKGDDPIFASGGGVMNS